MNIAKAGSWRGYHIFTDDIYLQMIYIYMYTYTYMIIYGVYLHVISFFEVRHHMCVYIYKYIYIYLHVISKKHV
jgi:hypothetical protein